MHYLCDVLPLLFSLHFSVQEQNIDPVLNMYLQYTYTNTVQCLENPKNLQYVVSDHNTKR